MPTAETVDVVVIGKVMGWCKNKPRIARVERLTVDNWLLALCLAPRVRGTAIASAAQSYKGSVVSASVRLFEINQHCVTGSYLGCSVAACS